MLSFDNMYNLSELIEKITNGEMTLRDIRIDKLNPVWGSYKKLIDDGTCILINGRDITGLYGPRWIADVIYFLTYRIDMPRVLITNTSITYEMYNSVVLDPEEYIVDVVIVNSIIGYNIVRRNYNDISRMIRELVEDDELPFEVLFDYEYLIDHRYRELNEDEDGYYYFEIGRDKRRRREYLSVSNIVSHKMRLI